MLELHGWGSLGDRLRGLARCGEHDAMAAQVPDGILDTFCVVARTWGDAIELAACRYQGIVDRVMFQSAPPAIPPLARRTSWFTTAPPN